MKNPGKNFPSEIIMPNWDEIGKHVHIYEDADIYGIKEAEEFGCVWIPVELVPPRCDCPCIDNLGNNPFIPYGVCEIPNTDGEKEYYDKMPSEKGFGRKIRYWMPYPICTEKLIEETSEWGKKK